MDYLRESYRYGKSPLAPNAINQPRQVYFFGTPISKALSSVLVPILFKSVPTQWKFIPVDTALTIDFVKKRDRADFMGSSLTMPNKISYMPFLHDLTEEARTIGAVNTTFVRLDHQNGQRRHIGTNTDCVGIRDTLLQKVDGVTELAKNRPAMVVGAGGAARSAIYALWRWMKPSEIYIVNRLKSEVDEMISSFQSNISGIKLRYNGTVEEMKSLPTPYIIVGTIPDYPAKEPGEITCVHIYKHFLAREDKGVLLEMCYVPNFLTKLFVAGEDEGWIVISGMDVVVRVIAVQLMFWLEREPSDAGIKQILDVVYERTSNNKTRLSNL